MTATARLYWFPERFNARLAAAAAPARQEWAQAARLKSRSRSVAAGVRVVGDHVIAAHPRSMIEEEGARPHVIEPRSKKALKLADGSFVSGPVNHPGMAARPFMRPTLPLWTPLYRRSASRMLRGV